MLYVAMTRPKDRLIMTYASKNLEADLQDLALRCDISGMEQLTKDADCPGTWVLLSAIGRTEAGQLHELGGKPAQTRISDSPWLIRVKEAQQQDTEKKILDTAAPELPDESFDKLKESLAFSYAHGAATLAPSKMTAPQRKGRS